MHRRKISTVCVEHQASCFGASKPTRVLPSSQAKPRTHRDTLSVLSSPAAACSQARTARLPHPLEPCAYGEHWSRRTCCRRSTAQALEKCVHPSVTAVSCALMYMGPALAQRRDSIYTICIQPMHATVCNGSAFASSNLFRPPPRPPLLQERYASTSVLFLCSTVDKNASLKPDEATVVPLG